MLRGLGNKMRFWKRRDEEDHSTVEETPPTNNVANNKKQTPEQNNASSLSNDNDKVILKENVDEIEIGADNDDADAKSNVKPVEEEPNKEEVPPSDTKSPHKKKQKMQTISDADKVLVEGQHDREIKAEQEGLYVKNQRVKYHHRATDTYYDNAVICGVHFDDGPDKPYYTIKYTKKLDDGTEEAMEKQTTPDRLERVPWNEKATWAIMKKKK